MHRTNSELYFDTPSGLITGKTDIDMLTNTLVLDCANIILKKDSMEVDVKLPDDFKHINELVINGIRFVKVENYY